MLKLYTLYCLLAIIPPGWSYNPYPTRGVYTVTPYGVIQGEYRTYSPNGQPQTQRFYLQPYYYRFR